MSVDVAWEVSAMRKSWTRAERRKLKGSTTISDPNLAPAVLKAKVILSGTHLSSTSISPKYDDDEQQQQQMKVRICWGQGSEREIFESFWNHLIKKIIQVNL